jgi:hypothetical protein
MASILDINHEFLLFNPQIVILFSWGEWFLRLYG